MSKTSLSVEEAAKLAGKSTKTIYRWIGSGRISARVDKDGFKKISVSELARVVDLKTPHVTPGSRITVSGTDSETFGDSQVEALKQQVEALERLIREKDARIDGLVEDKQRLTLLLEHKTDDAKTEKQGVISGFIRKFGL